MISYKYSKSSDYI